MLFLEGAKMFSADSNGIVIIWNSYIHPQVDTKRKRKGTGGKTRLDIQPEDMLLIQLIAITLPYLKENEKKPNGNLLT